MEYIYNALFWNPKNHDGAAFMGGGILGYAHFGAVAALNDLGKLSSMKHFTGASVGSIIATICSMKPSSECLSQLHTIFEQNIHNIMKESWGYAGEGFRLIEKFGLYAGDKLRKMIELFIQTSCGNAFITFQEAYEKYGTHLIIPTTQVYTTGFETIYHSHILTPLEKISQVVYQSCAYPWVFEAENGICDGGLSDNFPIAQLLCHNALGFVFEKIVSQEKTIPKTLVQYSLGIAAGIRSRLEKEYTGTNIITLKTYDIHSLNFDLSDDEKKKLFDSAYDSVKLYFS